VEVGNAFDEYGEGTELHNKWAVSGEVVIDFER
jgi:hypothetical protein